MAKIFHTKEEVRGAFEDAVKSTTKVQERGFILESLLHTLLQLEHLEPRMSYRPKGEQVDGSFFWEGQTFLVEAKWVKKPIPASDIFSFKGKLDGKFHTTSGVFLSMSGFSEDAEEALKSGKALNILLFEESDLNFLLKGEVSFRNMLQYKVRQAGDTGTLLAPYRIKLESVGLLQSKPLVAKPTSTPPDSIYLADGSMKYLDSILVFVEGQDDIIIAQKLLQPRQTSVERSYIIIPLHGINNVRKIPALVNDHTFFRPVKAVIILLDNDQEYKRLEPIISSIKDQLEESSIPIETLLVPVTDKQKIFILSQKEAGNRPTKLFNLVDDFIERIAEEYKDSHSEIDISRAVTARMNDINWDYEENVGIILTDDHNSVNTLENFNDLVNHISEEIEQLASEDMPIEIIHEFGVPGYRQEIVEFLQERYGNLFKKLGWEIDDF